MDHRLLVRANREILNNALGTARAERVTIALFNSRMASLNRMCTSMQNNAGKDAKKLFPRVDGIPFPLPADAKMKKRKDGRPVVDS